MSPLRLQLDPDYKPCAGYNAEYCRDMICKYTAADDQPDPERELFRWFGLLGKSGSGMAVIVSGLHEDIGLHVDSDGRIKVPQPADEVRPAQGGATVTSG